MIRATMYQRRHQKSSQAIAKPYRFLQLPMSVDTETLVAELANVDLPWLSSQWKWHLGTFFCILRAGSPGNYLGHEMISGAGVDAPILSKLPAFKHFLDHGFPIPVSLAWIGLSPANSCIKLHIDNTTHWDEHHRLHIPLQTNAEARLCCLGKFLHLKAGTVWAFNNSVPHGALNTGSARLHLMVDLPSTAAVENLLASGQMYDGELDSAALARLSSNPLQGLSEDISANRDLMNRLLQQ
ncbi:aspartyl/asparaginyl beta-hydroxylase domain-containing protein [Desmonostoc muscorum LEGE 12446]|uniref:Aspartyl/asparaginyl beta-hydroxylase domain-containing protein n=1 Tax=Desmonostoc muscorum LEGE 12446 TaxID=1828758 RepID=A0A8J7CWG7_DESMC|nr:aspartyl/asparaginyl beta-hydroxylase domain-containing protein [Desmonostoc muscorum]MCF2151392.1 aspartyl/asparaginyl beta-hydroxylase domain-containing protein [Desmonostoc muscorum LEGE 12446]